MSVPYDLVDVCIPIQSNCHVGTQENKSWACMCPWSIQDLVLFSRTGHNIVTSGPIFVCGNGGYHAVNIDPIIAEPFDKF